MYIGNFELITLLANLACGQNGLCIVGVCQRTKVEVRQSAGKRKVLGEYMPPREHFIAKQARGVKYG